MRKKTSKNVKLIMPRCLNDYDKYSAKWCADRVGAGENKSHVSYFVFLFAQLRAS